jgi:long-chain acyl-CoA synthetase
MVYASIYELLAQQAASRPQITAVLVKEGGAYRPVDWLSLYEQVQRVARALVSLGVRPGDRVCLAADTRLAWVTIDLGIVAAGGVTVPIYASESADGCRHVAQNSGAVVVFAEDAALVEKLKRERSRLGGVRQVIQLCGSVEPSDGWVRLWDEILQGAVAVDAELAERRRALTPQGIATIIYTAGTTGWPKGVVLTHANLLYVAQGIANSGFIDQDDVQLIYLPLAHSLGKVLVLSWLTTGHTLAFAESPNTVMRNLLEVRPTIMAGVPRLYERIYATITQRALASGLITSRLFLEAAELSRKRGEAEAGHRELSALESIELATLGPLVFDRVRIGLLQAMGGRMRLMFCGGAPLSAKVAWFLRDAGLDVLEGYGLTETSAATTLSLPKGWRIGAVGLPLEGTELRSAEDGVLDSAGWLHTGDIGFVDGEGFLHITDRKKDIIVTAGGKNVSPQNLENLLKSYPLISHAVVHGDRRKFLCALVTLEGRALRAFASERSLGDSSYAELTQKHEVRQAVEDIVARVNEQLASFEQLRRFKILEHDFTIEAGELAASDQVKRRVIYERYRSIFDSFYEEQY